jgi:predicted enzyme related to lactoylglutathione lyase
MLRQAQFDLQYGLGKINRNNRERRRSAMSKDLPSETPVRVAGIGGVFLKANDPATLAQWYTKHLGIAFQGGGDDCGTDENFWTEFVCRDDADSAKRVTVVFAIQSAKSHLPAERHAVEINYRVADLDRLLNQLNAAGIAVEKREDYDYGRFAWIRDPENNRLELYEPR